MGRVFINAFEVGDKIYAVNLETLIIVSICQSNETRLNIRLLQSEIASLIRVNFAQIPHKVTGAVPDLANYCTWPVVVTDSCAIAGLCAVAREIVKASDGESRKLLGFREACLMACSESSVWTKFCEVDIIETINNILGNPNNYFSNEILKLPPDLARFEYHMAQPVRIHNIYKLARETNKALQNGTPVDQLSLSHTYSEGPFMTLADIILFPCYQIFFALCHDSTLLSEKLPLTVAWYNTVKDKVQALQIILLDSYKFVDIINPEVPKQSLYKADPSRYKPGKRIFTKQKAITNSLEIVGKIAEITNNLRPFGAEIPFSWDDVPAEVRPSTAALPQKRIQRKCEQLQNLIKAVLAIAKEQSLKIVEFCSGSGHLGLLLAFLLPQCQVVLVENKERSLSRALSRMKALKLKNVSALQSNLDYFVGKFDIGVSLHACGVATDLVIQMSVENGAHFVCCPCCYGGIHDCYHLKYPRSDKFRQLDVGDYLILAHAADQTHQADNCKTAQGFVCMDVIDVDRKLFAEQWGYEVHLGKLSPASCTNKNNLLVGLLTDR